MNDVTYVDALKLSVNSIAVIDDKEIVSGNEGIVGDVLTGIDNLLVRGIKNMQNILLSTNIVLDGVSEYKTKTPSVKELQSYRTTLKRVLNQKDFNVHNVVKRNAPVTLGLDVTLNKLVDIISGTTIYTNNAVAILEKHNSIILDMMSVKTSELGNYIPNNRDLYTLTNNNKNIIKSLQTITNDKVKTDRKKLLKVVDKINTVPDLIDDTLALGKTLSYEELDTLREITEEITGNSTTLVDSILANDKKIDNKTKEALSYYLKTLAEYITNVTFVYYAYLQLVDMLVAVVKVIEKEDKDNILLGALKDTNENLIRSLKSIFK